MLFPRKIDGKYFMLSRPSDNGHTPFGDIYISQSPDMCHWGMHRKVMGRGGDEQGIWWQRTKIGAGPIPIETDDGWLMIYHGVIDTCNGFVYHMGAALLDLDEPWRVTYRVQEHPAHAGGRLRSVRPRAERRVPGGGVVRTGERSAGDLLRRGRHGDVPVLLRISASWSRIIKDNSLVF